MSVAVVLEVPGGFLALAPPPGRSAYLRVPSGALALPAQLRDWIERLPPGTSLRTGTRELAERFRAVGLESRAVTPEEIGPARAAWPELSAAEEARWLRRAAQEALEARERQPTAILTALVREWERLERSWVREQNALGSLPAPSGTPLAEYRASAAPFHRAFGERRAALSDAVARSAGAIAPNLSALVGPRTAARLLAAAGGLEPLSRMAAGELQLLGARRRHSPGRTPRHGWIRQADGMAGLPPRSVGRYARSLAALAVLAARIDATSRADRRPWLLDRRDRVLSRLQRGGA